MIYAILMVNFEVKLTLHDFNTLFYFDKAKQTFSSVVYAILQCKKNDILEPNRTEPNPGGCRTRTEPNPSNEGSFPSLIVTLSHSTCVRYM